MGYSATEWHFSRLFSPYQPATWHGGWNLNGTFESLLDPLKTGAGISTASRNDTSATNPNKVGVIRGVSRKLKAQTISGTVDFIISALESNAAANFYTKLYIWVTQGDSDIARGVALDYEETSAGGGIEWPTTAAGIRLLAAQTLTNVNALDGDRLVIELGVRAENAVTTSYTASIRCGTRSSQYEAYANLAFGGTDVTVKSNVITFSNAIELADDEIININPENAIDVTTFPHLEVYNPIYYQIEQWFKFTPGSLSDVTSWFAGVDSAVGTYKPYFEAFRQLSGAAYPTLGYSSDFYRAFNYFPNNLNTTYFQIVDYNGNLGLTDRNLQLSVVQAPNGATVNDSIFITSDSATGPKVGAGLLSPIDGSYIRSVNTFPTSENGCRDILGNIFLSDKLDETKAYLYTNAFVLITEVNVTSATGQDECAVCSDGVDFYIAQRQAANTVSVWKIDVTGAVLDSWTGLTCTAGKDLRAIAVLGDYLYYHGFLNDPIRKYNIVTDTQEADFLAAGGANVYYNGIVVLADGRFLIGSSEASSAFNRVYIYTTAGVLEATLELGSTDSFGDPLELLMIQVGINDPDAFWVWTQADISGDNKNRLIWSKYRTSDFTLLTTFYKMEFLLSWGPLIAEGDLPDEYFGVPRSCPLILMSLGAPSNTIVVIKVTVPDGSPQSFDFTTTGGLSPTIFNLVDDGSQEFTGLADGTYGIEEDQIPGWLPPEITVSNGDPISAIAVAGGQTVTVTVTNRQLNLGSGIYKIVPGKRTDTLWAENFINTLEVAIPNPRFKLGYTGD